MITGLDPNVALFTAGLGTILFQIVTGRQVPVFLASSFAFITPIILAKGQFGLAATMGGVMAAGFVYTFLGLAVKIKCTGFIDRLLPPVMGSVSFRSAWHSTDSPTWPWARPATAAR